MANSANVDERVIQMRMDNDQFEKGAEKTISTLDKLKKSIDSTETEKSFKGFDLSPIEKGIDKITDKFSALGLAGKRVIENLTDSAMNLAKQAITGADYISPGYKKYEEQVRAIQKLKIATGESMDVVQDMSDKLMKFTDETSYQYDAMLNTMSAFTSSGVDLKDAMNTILGMAIAAGKSGVSAENATHAFMGFQKAVAANKMSQREWDWIRTAGMNTADLKETLLEAAVAVGSLEKGSDGVYYALEQTAKGVKKTEVSVSNFETTFKTGWLNREAIIKGMAKYTPAFNELYEATKRAGNEGKSFEQLMKELEPTLDRFSFEALEAGQNTKTFGEAMEAVKTANTSSWMKSFELIIGNFEQARDFWSEMIGPLWDLLVVPGQKRVGFFEAAFGGGGEKTVIANWEKLSAKVKEVGKSTDDLEKAFNSVVGKSEDAKVRSLATEYNSLEEAIKNGAVSGELLKKILDEINGVTTESSKDAVEGANAATKAFSEYREVAMGVLRGDYGNGGDRKKKLAELGYDYDTIQWLAGNMQWLHQNGWSYDAISDEYLKSLPKFQHVQEVIDSLGKTTVAANEASADSYIDLNDVTDQFLEEASQMSGRELWQGAALNFINALAEAMGKLGEAFDEVFGDAKSRGEGFRGWLVRLYELSRGAEMTEERLDSIKNVGVRVFSSIKNGLSNVGKGIGVVRKLIRLVVGLIKDAFSWLSNLFSGKLQLPEQLQNTGGFLGKIFQFLNNIISKINEFTSKNSLLDILDRAIDKVEELRSYFKGGGKFGDLFKNLFGSEEEGKETTGFLSKFGSFFDQFQKDTDNISRSVEGVSDSVGILSYVLGNVGDVMSTLYEGIFGDPEKFREKISNFWQNFKSFFVDEYGKINWDTLFDVGRLGLVGFIIYRLNETFKTLKKLLGSSPNSILGILNNFANRISSPLASLSKAIENHEKSNRYLKIAAAIALLASSIYLLTKVDEQKFFNVAVTLGFLMAIMAKIAKNMDGFQLFSNNNKMVSKNNPIQNTVKAFESLQKLFTVDLTGATANISLLPKTMGTLLGIASVIVSVVYAIMKLKDVAKPGELEQLYPTFIILGSIFAAMTVMTVVLAAVTKNSKYIGKAGGAMLAMAASVYLIVRMITNIAQMNLNGGQIIMMYQALLMVVILLGAIGLVLFAAGKLTNQGQSAITSGSAVWAIAGIIIALALACRSMVKTMAKASEIQNLTKGVAILAGLFLGLITVFAVMSAIVSNNKTEPSGMLKLAASMVILAAAVAIMVPAIMIMAALPAKGLLAAAGAIAILVLAMAGVVFILNTLDTKQMLVTAAVFAVISFSMAALIATIGLLTIGMLTFIAVVPWDSLQGKFESFKKAMDTITPTLLTISVIVLIFGIGMLAAAAATGIFGLSFLAIAAGAYLAAAAFEKLVEAFNGLTRVLPNLMQGLADTGDIIGKNWWKIILVVGGVVAVLLLLKHVFKGIDFSGAKDKVGEFAGKIPEMIGKLVQAVKLASPQLINGILHLGILAITAFALLVPFAVKKLVTIIVTIITSLATAIQANADVLIGAFSQLFKTIVNIAFKAATTIIFEFFDLVWNFIIELVREFAGDRVAGLLDRMTKNANFFQGLEDHINTAADRALEKASENDKKVEIPVTADPKVEMAEITNNPEYQAAMAAYSENYSSDMATAGSEGGKALATSTSQSVVSSLLGGEGTGGIGNEVLGAFTTSISGTDTSEASDSVLGMAGDIFGGENLLSEIGDLGQGDGETWALGVGTGATDDTSSINLKNAATSAFNIFGNQLNTSAEEGTPGLGSSIVAGLYNAIIAKADEWLPGAGSYTFGKVKEGVESAAAISSPSKEMMKEGYWMVIGLANGIEQNSKAAYNAGTDISNGLVNEFQTAMQRVALIAGEDLTITPTITPVVDLTNVHSATGMVSSAFSQGYNMQAQMTGSINRRMSEVERVASNMDAASQTINNGDVYTINVYPSQGMDEEALADMVMDRMQTRMVRRSAAFG